MILKQLIGDNNSGATVVNNDSDVNVINNDSSEIDVEKDSKLTWKKILDSLIRILT